MSEEPLQPARQPSPPPQQEEELRGSAWMVAQQAAQMFGEVGGGAAGFATAAHLARGLVGGSKSGGDGGKPQQGQNPDNTK